MRYRWTLAALGLFLAPVAVVLAQATIPDSRAARDKIVAWIRANNKWGPDHAIVRDTSEQVDADIGRVNNLTLTYGSGLTRSGRPCQLCVWAGQFFAFELTNDQAKALGTGPSSMSYTTGTKQRDRRQTPPAVIISKPGLRDAQNLDGKADVSGAVTFKASGPLPEKSAIRMSFEVGQSTTSRFQYLDGGLPADGKLLTFAFKGINADRAKGEKDFAGPLVLFFDLCTVKEKDQAVEVTILSNSVAGLVDVKDND